VLAAAVGAGLLVLAVPRTLSAWQAVWAQPVLEILDRALADPLREAIANMRASTSRVPSAATLRDLGILEFTLAQTMVRTDPERAVAIAEGERHLTESLAANPVDGIAWYRLAQVRQQKGGDPRPVVTALLESVDMAPNYRPVLAQRTLGLIAYRPFLTAEEQRVADGQLRTFWRVADAPSRKMVGDYLKALPTALAAVEAAVRDDPQAAANVAAIRREMPSR
jgi:hypothetical protein